MSTTTHRLGNMGVTIVELLIAITLTTLMSAVVFGFMGSGIRNTTLGTAKQQLLQEAQRGLDDAANDIRLSSNPDTANRWPDSNAPNASDSYSWASGSSVIVLATAAQDSSHNIIFSDPSNYITEKNNIIYFVNNGILYRRVLASTITGNAAKTTCPAASASSSCPADRAVLHNVTSFSISYKDGSDVTVSPIDARSVILNVTLRTHKFGQDITASYKTRMVFRND